MQARIVCTEGLVHRPQLVPQVDARALGRRFSAGDGDLAQNPLELFEHLLLENPEVAEIVVGTLRQPQRTTN